MTREWYLADF